jgi:plastin-1
LNKLNLDATPQLMNLKVGDETGLDVNKVSTEDMLLRWFNHHLKNAGHNDTMTNYSDDVKDSVKYTELLNQLNAECGKAALNEVDPLIRACMVLDNSTANLNVPRLIDSNDVVNVNKISNTYREPQN